MASILPYIQVILSIVLVVLVLLQRSDESLGSAFGGGNDGGTRFVRRGFEKLMFNATILTAILFCLSAFASLLLNR